MTDTTTTVSPGPGDAADDELDIVLADDARGSGSELDSADDAADGEAGGAADDAGVGGGAGSRLADEVGGRVAEGVIGPDTGVDAPGGGVGERGEVRDLDARGVLDLLVERRRAADRAEAELLAGVVHLVDLHPVLDPDHAASAGDRPLIALPAPAGTAGTAALTARPGRPARQRRGRWIGFRWPGRAVRR